jgi:magnesium transporter
VTAMTDDACWVDLCDPDEAALRAALPQGIHDVTLERLLRPMRAAHESRPRIEVRGTYVFGVLVFPKVDGDGVVNQEIDVIATNEQLITIRKTLPGRAACDLTGARNASSRIQASPGMCLYMLFDEIAEQFLDVVDGFDNTIDELEDQVTALSNIEVRTRISETRHDILHVRRVLAPTRDAARAVLDDRVELEPETLFPREVELHFADTYDKLMRATDGLDLSRDLLAGVRDFHQAEVANDQNEVMKKLTAIASMLLVPTFIVGVYGQNLRGAPEQHWQHGYAFSWALIIVTTLLQFSYFRHKKWI